MQNRFLRTLLIIIIIWSFIKDQSVSSSTDQELSSSLLSRTRASLLTIVQFCMLPLLWKNILNLLSSYSDWSFLYLIYFGITTVFEYKSLRQFSCTDFRVSLVLDFIYFKGSKRLQSLLKLHWLESLSMNISKSSLPRMLSQISIILWMTKWPNWNLQGRKMSKLVLLSLLKAWYSCHPFCHFKSLSPVLDLTWIRKSSPWLFIRFHLGPWQTETGGSCLLLCSSPLCSEH